MKTNIADPDEPEDEPSFNHGDIEADPNEWEIAEKSRRFNLKMISDVVAMQLGHDVEQLEKLPTRARDAFLADAYKAMSAIVKSFSMDYEQPDDTTPFTIDTSRFGKDM